MSFTIIHNNSYIIYECFSPNDLILVKHSVCIFIGKNKLHNTLADVDYEIGRRTFCRSSVNSKTLISF